MASRSIKNVTKFMVCQIAAEKLANGEKIDYEKFGSKIPDYKRPKGEVDYVQRFVSAFNGLCEKDSLAGVGQEDWDSFKETVNQIDGLPLRTAGKSAKQEVSADVVDDIKAGLADLM